MTTFASIDPLALAKLLLIPILVGFFVTETDRQGGRLALWVIYLAARLLPRGARQEHEDEWLDHVLADGEFGLRPLLSALGIALFAAPSLAITERFSLDSPQTWRVFELIRGLVEIEASPPVPHLDYVGEIQLLRMSDLEIVELQHAVHSARRRGQRIPLTLIRALSSNTMSHRAHAMRGRVVQRNPRLVRWAARLKYYWLVLSVGAGEVPRSELRRQRKG